MRLLTPHFLLSESPPSLHLRALPAVVATCEVVNSNSVEEQSTGAVPTVAVDKCDGCQVGPQAGRARVGRSVVEIWLLFMPTVAPGWPCEGVCVLGLEPGCMVAQWTRGFLHLHPLAAHLPHAYVLMPAPVPQLYLPRESLAGTDITTAKSSEVNVVVPGATGEQASSAQHA